MHANKQNTQNSSTQTASKSQKRVVTEQSGQPGGVTETRTESQAVPVLRRYILQSVIASKSSTFSLWKWITGQTNELARSWNTVQCHLPPSSARRSINNPPFKIVICIILSPSFWRTECRKVIKARRHFIINSSNIYRQKSSRDLMYS